MPVPGSLGIRCTRVRKNRGPKKNRDPGTSKLKSDIRAGVQPSYFHGRADKLVENATRASGDPFREPSHAMLSTWLCHGAHQNDMTFGVRTSIGWTDFRLLNNASGPEIVDFWEPNGPLLPQSQLEKVGIPSPFPMGLARGRLDPKNQRCQAWKRY